MGAPPPPGATWVRFPRFVGDAVMQFPVLRALRAVGAGPLVVWGPAATVALVDGHPLADAVIPDVGRPGPWAMAALLRTHRAARSVHFPKSLRPALAAFLARVPERIGVDESLAGLFNTHSAPFWGAPGHFLDRYHAVLAQRWPGLPPLPPADYTPPGTVALPGAPYLCLMPGSMWPSKAWPADHFRRVAAIARAAGLQIAVLGAPAERELCAQVIQPGDLDLVGRTTLVEAAAWLKGARAALGNDSGLCHLAAACGTPTLALFGPTDATDCAPVGPRAATLRLDGIPCAPCRKRVCAVAGHPCLAQLGPERAWSALEALVSR
ncbi:glycosyltransferase family 9 protein [Mesoterricola sediminis]|uniref:Glycosyl transferase n=1 Tax=Mesoterricola sediminis TaxID=2927980 RepID=A0AA48H086_9BACT|nr:glycosyltransferase family 9 protein [Mesoterricola sediminis]BDU78850.1 glycosyl transferase [Mesoterricola sediminis]